MKTRPILFSAPMIRAILDGRKTITRRIMNPQPNGTWAKNPKTGMSGMLQMPEYAPGVPWWILGGVNGGKPCKYGAIGDLLWVRETFCIENTYEYHGHQSVPTDGRPIEKYETHWLIPHYRATEPEPNIVSDDADDDRTRWTPSIFMPRWASRITLEITGVRAERLQEITRGDCMAEGCPFPNMARTTDPIGWFSDLWETINGPGSWEANPFLWVIEFKRIE